MIVFTIFKEDDTWYNITYINIYRIKYRIFLKKLKANSIISLIKPPYRTIHQHTCVCKHKNILFGFDWND